jgi:hypothetical protein
MGLLDYSFRHWSFRHLACQSKQGGFMVFSSTYFLQYECSVDPISVDDALLSKVSDASDLVSLNSCFFSGQKGRRLEVH